MIDTIKYRAKLEVARNQGVEGTSSGLGRLERARTWSAQYDRMIACQGLPKGRRWHDDCTILVTRNQDDCFIWQRVGMAIRLAACA